MIDDRKPEGTEKLEIVVDGRRYRSVEEMPPDVRKVYEETRKALSSAPHDPNAEVRRIPGGAIIRSRDPAVTIDGERVDPDAMPPELRRAYDEALAKLDRPDPSPGRVAEGTLGEPERGARRHSVRIESRTQLGGRPSFPLQPRGPLWMNALVLLICAAILVAIWMAY